MKKLICASGMLIILVSFVGCGSRQENAGAPGSAAVVAQEDFVARAEKLLAEKNYTEAVRLFQNVVAKDPSNVNAHFVLGQTYMQLENYNDALKQFEIVVGLDSQNQDAYLLLGGCHDLLGERAKAIEMVKKSIEISQAKQDEESFRRSVVVLQQLMAAEQKLMSAEQKP